MLLLAFRPSSNKWEWGATPRPIGPWITMLALGLCPIILRLTLLPRHPVPVPSGADDFGYLLLADTLRHGRLANPPHAFPEFFEQIFVLQRPTYSSIYPLGQGLVLAAAMAVVQLPWAGVLICSGALAAAMFWALSGWVSSRWALLAGILAIAQFGPLSYWMNCYWGGYVSAIAGCLVFGAMPRVLRGRSRASALVLGLGLAIQLLTRPFEFLLLAMCAFGVLPMMPGRGRDRRGQARSFFITLAVLMPAAGLVLLQNQRVTGSASTLPYQSYRHRYGVPATFTFQPNPVPANILNDEQRLDYVTESAVHGAEPESIGRYIERLVDRLRFLRFFLPPALYVPALLCFAPTVLPTSGPALLCIALFIAGSNFFPYFYPHYVAALSPLFLLLPILGLQYLSRQRSGGLTVRAFVACSVLPFLFWFGIHAFAPESVRGKVIAFESWDFLNVPDPAGRQTVATRLSGAPGKQLVFVQYSPGHSFAEWVHNSADIDASKVIVVHDLGFTANTELQKHYPDRHAWLLQPDFDPPKLTRIEQSTTPFENVP